MGDAKQAGHVSKERLTSAGAAAVRLPAAPAAQALLAAPDDGQAPAEPSKWTYDELIDSRQTAAAVAGCWQFHEDLEAELSQKWPPAVTVRDKILPAAALSSLQSSLVTPHGAQSDTADTHASKRARIGEPQASAPAAAAQTPAAGPLHAEAPKDQASELSEATLWEVPIEEELSTHFEALAPARAVYDARRMRVAPKQAPALGTAADADLRALLAELRWATGGLASAQLPARRAAARGAPSAQPPDAPQQDAPFDSAEPGVADGAAEAELQAGDVGMSAGQTCSVPEDSEAASTAEEDAASRAAEGTARLAYLLLEAVLQRCWPRHISVAKHLKRPSDVPSLLFALPRPAGAQAQAPLAGKQAGAQPLLRAHAACPSLQAQSQQQQQQKEQAEAEPLPSVRVVCQSKTQKARRVVGRYNVGRQQVCLEPGGEWVTLPAFVYKGIHKGTDWRRHVTLLGEDDRPGQLLYLWLAQQGFEEPEDEPKKAGEQVAGPSAGAGASEAASSAAADGPPLTAEQRALLRKREKRAAWRNEALQRLAPPPAPALEDVDGVKGDARTVFDAAAALGVRPDVVSRAARRWRAMVH